MSRVSALSQASHSDLISGSALRLTDEQQAVVGHDTGPALVFAVAGAGKTTAMVHRIERLVRQGVFAPQRILATSFGKATVDELKSRLGAWDHCEPVRPMTLHGIGWRVMKQMQTQGLIPRHFQLPGGEENSKMLYYETLKQARRQKGEFGDLDSLAADDFLDWVGTCKGNLQYADLAAAHLPEAAKALASQAEAPRGLRDYLPLFRLFERVRLQLGILTFDDLLVGSWEAFLRHPGLLESWRGRFDCLLVDEFQDINLAQSELLDLLSRRHSNYMAIGDDDQTIYEWRGARPDFILDFVDRYAARRYLLSENFRSPAAPLALADAVIQLNERRAPKHLRLTRGFGGQTTVQACKDGAVMGDEVVKRIEAELKAGLPARELAVLVRTYAQTPYIERALIDKGIPYRLPDGRLFYQRPEIRDLLSYIALARLDLQIKASGPLDEDELATWTQHWNRIRNRPGRYFSNQLSQDLLMIMRKQDLGLGPALNRFAGMCEDYLAERLRTLAGHLDWLGGAWERGADGAASLKELDRRLGWCTWLESSSASKEEGRERADNVRAFLDFARELGSLPDLIEELKRLSADGQAARRKAEECVTLTSIHRAKGLEWQTVLIPGCNEGIYPPDRDGDPEAERRLFYVALTRPKANLHLFYSLESPISLYLRQVGHEGLIRRCESLSKLLTAAETATLNWEQIRELFAFVPPSGFERYFRLWHRFAPSSLARIQGALNWLQANELWHVSRLDPRNYGIWCDSDEARAIRLSADELSEAETALMPTTPLLAPGQVRHARYGIGTVLKSKLGRDANMILVRFAAAGKVQLPEDDPELTR